MPEGEWSRARRALLGRLRDALRAEASAARDVARIAGGQGATGVAARFEECSRVAECRAAVLASVLDAASQRN